MKLTDEDIKNFWDRVDIKSKDECWNWKAGKKPSGYGNFRLNCGKTTNSHRTAWSIVNGDIPKGKCILHKCDNKSCCNPNHLYCGTQSDNVRDACIRNPTSPEVVSHPKLYAGEIWLIRRLMIKLPWCNIRQKYKYSARYVSNMFKVSPQTILKIWNSDKYLCKEGYYI